MGMAENIKRLRLEKGWTQEELGERVGIQKSAVAKYENGRVTNMRRPMIQKMAEVFGVDPSFLMGFDDDFDEARIQSLVQNDLLKKLLLAGGKVVDDNPQFIEAIINTLEQMEKNK